QILSTRVINPRGPMQVLICVVAFAGIAFKNWKILDKSIKVVGAVLAAYVLVSMINLGLVNRSIAMNVLTSPLNPLYWAGAYILLSAKQGKSSWRLFKWFPITVYALGSVVTQ